MGYKNRIIAIGLLIASLACSNEVNKANNDVFSYSYSKGEVYIGSQSYLDSLQDLKPNDILILDERDASDPNIKIYDSYKTSSVKEMEEIINILLEYEKNDPSEWDRTFESMRAEWIYHNLSFYFNYKTERTKDVDLNNNDEYTYKKILKK